MLVEITYNPDPAKVGQLVDLPPVEARILIAEGRAREAVPHANDEQAPHAQVVLDEPDVVEAAVHVADPAEKSRSTGRR